MPKYEVDDTTKTVVKGQTLEPFEAIAKRKSTEDWVRNAAAAYHRWAIGKEVTEADFDAAVTKMLGVTLSGG